MNVNTNAMVSMTEANQNFSRVARLVDEQGAAIIMKNNRPKYILLDFERTDAEASAGRRRPRRLAPPHAGEPRSV